MIAGIVTAQSTMRLHLFWKDLYTSVGCMPEDYIDDPRAVELLKWL